MAVADPAGSWPWTGRTGHALGMHRPMTSPRPRVPPPAPRPRRGFAPIGVVVALIALVLAGVAPVGASEPTTRPDRDPHGDASTDRVPSPDTRRRPPRPRRRPTATPGADTAAAAEATTRRSASGCRRRPRPRRGPVRPRSARRVRFYGRGYGHGVGMSQYGARGRALAGQDATEILAHYYQGAVLGSIDLATTIRVRVLVELPGQQRLARSCSTAVAGRGRSTASRRRSRPTPRSRVTPYA